VIAWAIVHIAGGLAKTTAGFVLLSLHAYGWAALFLAAGMVADTLGYGEMSIARSTVAVA
jgi:NADH:ubiquinone oxidoreductase subunit 5 (subunit L)/multisubunit Na+/H+ antiporter MnhA subunit